MIWVHQTIQCSSGYNTVVTKENEIEHCSTILYPQYDYGLPINIVGVYRPPEYKHPSYDQALAK